MDFFLAMLGVGMAVGIPILCVGIGDYLEGRAHREKDNGI